MPRGIAACVAVLFAAAVSIVRAREASVSPEGVVEPLGSTEWDSDGGYLTYCPASGRFGNQMDHLLGAFHLAARLNRTLVVPPLLDWSTRPPTAVPLDGLFSFPLHDDDVRFVHAVDFFRNPSLAPSRWPIGSRKAYIAQMPRGVLRNMLVETPCQSFWLQVGFDTSRLPRPDTEPPTSGRVVKVPATLSWASPSATLLSAFPAASHPVLLWPFAPGPYPVRQDAITFQRLLRWSVLVEAAGKRVMLDPPLTVAVHLRVGVDWYHLCHGTPHASPAVGKPQSHSSPQCLTGEFATHGVTAELCLPSPARVARDVQAAVHRIGARRVFVASDTDASEYMELLRNNVTQRGGGNVEVVTAETVHAMQGQRRAPTTFSVDLYLLTQAEYFLGSCLSSFTHFASRHRDLNGLSTGFLGLGASP